MEDCFQWSGPTLNFPQTPESGSPQHPRPGRLPTQTVIKTLLCNQMSAYFEQINPRPDLDLLNHTQEDYTTPLLLFLLE